MHTTLPDWVRNRRFAKKCPVPRQFWIYRDVCGVDKQHRLAAALWDVLVLQLLREGQGVALVKLPAIFDSDLLSQQKYRRRWGRKRMVTGNGEDCRSITRTYSCLRSLNVISQSTLSRDTMQSKRNRSEESLRTSRRLENMHTHIPSIIIIIIAIISQKTRKIIKYTLMPG